MKKLILALIFCLFTLTAAADLGRRQSESVLSLNSAPAQTWFGGYMMVHGTGFVIHPNYVLTAGHMVTMGNAQTFTAYDGNTPVSLTAVAWDTNRDLALLYSPNHTFSTAPLRVGVGSRVSQGTSLAGYGNFSTAPNEPKATQRLLMSAGQYSSTSGNFGYSTVLVRQGFSGGPVINRNTNRLEGVVSAHLPDHSLMYCTTDSIASFLRDKGYGALVGEQDTVTASPKRKASKKE